MLKDWVPSKMFLPDSKINSQVEKTYVDKAKWESLLIIKDGLQLWTRNLSCVGTDETQRFASPNSTWGRSPRNA